MSFHFGKFSKVLLLCLFFFSILLFYIHNVTRDVYSGDIGDLATAAYVFGVPHPPGYPLLTSLGFLFTHLPIPLPPVGRMSLISALSAFFGTVFYFIFSLQVFKDYFSGGDKGKKRLKNAKEIGGIWETLKIPGEVLVACILATGVLAFSYMYWLYAEVPEVFGLSNFFLILLYFLAYQFYRTEKDKYLYAVAFVAGLSLTNQQAILAGFPGIAILVLPGLWKIIVGKDSGLASLARMTKREKGHSGEEQSDDSRIKIKNTLKTIGRLFSIFLLGLLPYLYIFIAASTNPPVNWMGEPTLNNFVRLLLRMDYTFAKNLISISQRLIILGIYFSSLVNEFSIIVVAVCVFGGLGLVRKNKYLFWTLLSAFIICGPLFIFVIAPGINDPDDLGVLERFYMHSYILFLLFLPFGIFTLQMFIRKYMKRSLYSVLFLVPLMIVVIQMIYYTGQKTDLSNTHIGNNFAYDLLSPLPKNTLFFPVGDSATLNSWYVHYVLGFRPDITFMGVFGDRGNFEKQFVKSYKEKHKQTTLKDIEILKKNILEIKKYNPIYTMYIFDLPSKEYLWMPVGLTYALTKQEDVPALDTYKKQIKIMVENLHIPYRDTLPLAEQNNITPYTSRQYSYSMIAIGDFFYLRYDDKKTANEYYILGQKIDPYNSLSYAKIGILQGEENLCDKAVKNIDTSIEMYRIYKPYYTFALRIYKRCKVGKEKVNALKDDYRELFGKNLEQDPHY